MNKCFIQQPPLMQVRAEVAGPDPAPPVLLLNLGSVSSLFRGKAKIPRSPPITDCRGRVEVQKCSQQHTMVPFEEHIDSFSLLRERLQTHPKSTYYYHSKKPLPFLTASLPAQSLKNQSSLFAATEAPNTSNSHLTHLQSHYPLHFQGSSSILGSGWGQAPLIKYQEHPFGQSSMRNMLCISEKQKSR